MKVKHAVVNLVKITLVVLSLFVVLSFLLIFFLLKVLDDLDMVNRMNPFSGLSVEAFKKKNFHVCLSYHDNIWQLTHMPTYIISSR